MSRLDSFTDFPKYPDSKVGALLSDITNVIPFLISAMFAVREGGAL